jgi:hypothetical protein
VLKDGFIGYFSVIEVKSELVFEALTERSVEMVQLRVASKLCKGFSIHSGLFILLDDQQCDTTDNPSCKHNVDKHIYHAPDLLCRIDRSEMKIQKKKQASAKMLRH